MLLASGFLAAIVSVVLDLNWKLPGHAILRAVLPMSLGFALAPRRFAGTVMGATAFVTALGLNVSGRFDIGWGAITNLVMTGPLLDLALYFIRTPWQVPLAFGLGGLATNLLAFAFRAIGKLSGISPGGQPFGVWAARALPWYVLFGVTAGLVSALIWFRLRPREFPTENGLVRDDNDISLKERHDPRGN